MVETNKANWLIGREGENKNMEPTYSNVVSLPTRISLRRFKSDSREWRKFTSEKTSATQHSTWLEDKINRIHSIMLPVFYGRNEISIPYVKTFTILDL